MIHMRKQNWTEEYMIKQNQVGTGSEEPCSEKKDNILPTGQINNYLRAMKIHGIAT